MKISDLENLEITQERDLIQGGATAAAVIAAASASGLSAYVDTSAISFSFEDLHRGHRRSFASGRARAFAKDR